MKKSTTQRIGNLIYPMRVVGYSILSGTIYLFNITFFGVVTSLEWVFIIWYLAIPHVSYLIYKMFGQTRRIEYVNLTVDMFWIGWATGLLGFSPVYFLPYFLNNSATNLATNGLRLFAQGILTFLVGVLASWLIYSQPMVMQLDIWVGIGGIIYLLLGFHYIALLSYYNGARLRNAVSKIEIQNDELENWARELEVASEEVSKRNEDMHASISYANRIQRAMLPTKTEMTKAFPDHFLFYRPKDIVSGDFYWIAQSEEKYFIAVGDCTGHGIPGAFMSLIGINTLSEIVNIEKIHDPAQVLEKLRERILKALRQRSTGNQDGMDIVFCAIDKKSKGGKRTVSYSGAGNGILLVRNGEIERHKGDALIIGGYVERQVDIHFKTHSITLDSEENTTLYLASDGYQDQFGGDYDKKFTAKRLRLLLKEIHTLPMVEQEQKLDLALEGWKDKSSVKQVDDVTVIGIRVQFTS